MLLHGLMTRSTQLRVVTVAALAFTALGVSACEPGDAGSQAGASTDALPSSADPSTPSDGRQKRAAVGDAPEEPAAGTDASETPATEGDAPDAAVSCSDAPATDDEASDDPMARFAAKDCSQQRLQDHSLEGRAGAGGDSPETWTNGSAPSQDDAAPGASFSKELYGQVAALPNDKFILLRTAIIKDTNGEAEQLRRSFYSNGCTGLPQAATWPQWWKGCAQHDFRYTVGPNIFKDDAAAAEADRLAADAQLGIDIGGVSGTAVRKTVNFVGSKFYQPTGTAGDEATTTALICKYDAASALSICAN